MPDESCPTLIDGDFDAADARCALFWQQQYANAIGSPLRFTEEQVRRFKEALAVEAVLLHGDGEGEAVLRALNPRLPDADMDDAADLDANDVDDAHIGYFAGHGAPGELRVLYEGGLGTLIPMDHAWGDGKLRWIVLDACNVLQPASRWSKTFAGVRYLLGWESFSEDEPRRGGRFAEYLNAGFPIRTAWRLACEETNTRLASASDGQRWSYLRAASDEDDTWCDRWTASHRAAPLTAPKRFVCVVGPA